MADMSKEQIKSIITNVINRNAEKAVNQAAYDRTILATIQYCIDSSLGQYKIKYQDGYYTAYASNSDSYMYTEGAAVFVTVPGNNFNNRLFITGSASNYNGDKTYLVNMEPEQQYKIKGPNILTVGTNQQDLNLSTYWCSTRIDTEQTHEYVKKYYSSDTQNNIIEFIEGGIDSLKQSEHNYFKLNVSFKTSILDSRKNTGDYGVKLVLKFKNPEKTDEDVIKTYEINTFSMIGSPFNFNDYITQSAYWELPDMKYFVGIQEISGFVRNFPIVTSSSSDWENSQNEEYRDIFIKDIEIYPAIKLYNDVNTPYKVNIFSDDSFFTFGTDPEATINCTAQFFVNGQEVKNDNGQDLKYYWGKEDSTIDSPNNSRYNSALGIGFYCLNPCRKKVSDASSIEDFKESSINDIDQDVVINTSNDQIEWNTTVKSIKLKKTLFKGQIGKIKCVIEYGGQLYTSELQSIYNKQGLYVLIGSQNSVTSGSNGLGYFTIAAGVFSDSEDAPDGSATLDGTITYKWVEEKDGVTRSLPLTSSNEILLSDPAWDSTHDNETLGNSQIIITTSSAVCIERYNYYKEQYDFYYNIPEDQRGSYVNPNYQTRLTRCKTRKENIITNKINEIYNKFDANYTNEIGYYILGASDVEGIYDQEHSYISARIKKITCRDTAPLTPIYNTLYKLPVSNITDFATYKVSAIKTENGATFEIGSASIILTNEKGGTLDYSLEIINGVQAYMYDEQGRAPTSTLVSHPITAQPLYFILRNQSGEILYDSSNPESYSDIDILELHPIWRFYDPKYSFISTTYTGDGSAGSRSSDDPDIWTIEDQAFFYYTLREDYSPYYRNNSNIELQVTYDGKSIFSSTSFVFNKQGELGTNGTDRTLSIYSDAYNNYKNGVLTNDKYSWFRPLKSSETSVKKQEFISPDERFLSKPYLFATDAYSTYEKVDGQNTSYTSIKQGSYVNLNIAQRAYATEPSIEEGIGIANTTSAVYQAKWYPTDYDATLDNTQWNMTEINKYNRIAKSGEDIYFYKPSVIVLESIGAKTTVQVSPQLSDDPALSYKPSPIDNFSYEGQICTRIGNNILQASAIRKVPEQDMDRTSYAFCTLPFFYFNYTYNRGNNPNVMPKNIDPARHIIITGGYDEVVYNSSGSSPVYNSQKPFQFYLIDETGKDITNEVLNAAQIGNAVIEWKSSKGFKKDGLTTQQFANTPAFESLPSNKDLLGKLCQYNNKYYKCIHAHIKNEAHTVDANHTYEPNVFVPNYWEEVDSSIYAQSVDFVPADSYESMQATELFNSWIYLYVQYGKYEAEVFLPINVYCNVYDDPVLNNWNGKKLVLKEDENGQSSIVANKVSAGKKDSTNQFLGISLGHKVQELADGKTEERVGLFGYGYKKKRNQYASGSNPTAEETLFLDAESGLAAFGPAGASQIVLDPWFENWSKLGGWYFSQNFLYKPVQETNPGLLTYDKIEAGESIQPGASQTGKSFGIYVPSGEVTVNDDTIAMWAGNTDDSNLNPGSDSSCASEAQFRLTYGGKLHATGADIDGWITAKGGSFTNDVASIEINTKRDGRNYILYNPAFGVYTSGNSNKTNLFVKGDIEAHSGIIGTGVSPTDVNTMYLMREYYPWVLPGDNEAWNDSTYHLNTRAGTTTNYILYHNNFSIDTSGAVRVDGNIFARSGRLGGWVVTKVLSDPTNPQSDSIDCLKAYTNNVILRSDGYATFGKLKINPNGSISGEKWSINENGQANFEHENNTFTAKTIYISGGGGGRFDGSGLHIPTGGSMTIGDQGAQLHSYTGGGFEFTGPGMNFNMDTEVTCDCRLVMKNSNYISLPGGPCSLGTTGLFMGSASAAGGQGTYWFKLNGDIKFFKMQNGSNSFEVTDNGDVTAHDVSVNSLTIDGVSLETYIKNIIDNISLSYSSGYAMNSSGTDSIKVITSVALTKPSTT